MERRGFSSTTKVDDQLLHLFNGNKEAQFYYEAANATIAVSRARRMNAGHAGLLEAGLRRALKDRLEYHGKYLTIKHPESFFVGVLDALLRSDMRMLQRAVLHRLKEEQHEMFAAHYYTVIDQPAACILEHPMVTFGKFLDELEHLKEVDKEFYAASFHKKRSVAALYRVGLACLPAEDWQAQVTLRRGSDPLDLPEAVNAGASIRPLPAIP